MYFSFHSLMKQFQLTDENNQTLELILFMMTQGHWELAASERTERQVCFVSETMTTSKLICRLFFNRTLLETPKIKG